MLPKYFKPKNEYYLIRLGQDNDGGYLVEKNLFRTPNHQLPWDQDMTGVLKKISTH